MTDLLKTIRKELKESIDLVYRKGERNFFKEKIHNMGVRMPIRRQIAKKHFKTIKDWPKAKVFKLSEKLLKGYSEEATIAFAFVYEIRDKYLPSDFKIFERWINKYVDNWAKCDDFCTHAVGNLVYQYPEFTKNLINWTKSKKRFVKRAAAVTLIYPFGSKKKYLTTIFKIAENLLTDEDDLVQKGYGWMLKEASNHNQREVFKFVMENKEKMPRTALRYAIEKMPKNLKVKAMAK